MSEENSNASAGAPIVSPDGVTSGSVGAGGGAPAEAAPVEWRDTQHAAHAETARLYEAMKTQNESDRAATWKKISQLHAHQFRGADKPAWFMPEQNDGPDLRPHDPLRDSLEKQSQPLNDATRDHLKMHGRVMGLEPQWSDAAAQTAQNLDLDPASAKTLINRVAKHASQLGESFQRLNEGEVNELAMEAARLAGGVEKMEEYSRGAREYLQQFPDVFAALEKHGAFESSLAFDVALLQTLYHAGLRRKVRGK